MKARSFLLSTFYFLLCASVALAITPRDRAVLSKAAATGAVASITVDVNWGNTASTTTPTRTLTVPSGSGGQITVTATGQGATTMEYQKAGGTWTSFTSGAVISVANGNTFAMRDTDVSVPIVNFTVTDTGTSAAVGTGSVNN